MEYNSSLRRYAYILFCLILALLVMSVLGFYRTYFHLAPQFTGMSLVVHFHVLSVFLWLMMLAAQAKLAISGRLTLHRKLGKASYLLVPLIIAGFVMVTNYGQLQKKDPGLFGAAIFDGSTFLIFFLLAIVHRKNTDYHARYMILTALPFINPSLGRMISPMVSLPVEVILILTLLIVDVVRKRPYRPYLTGLLVLLFSFGIVIFISVLQPSIIESMWSVIWG